MPEEDVIEYEEINGVIKCPYQKFQTARFRYCMEETCKNRMNQKKCGTRYSYCRTEELEDAVLSAQSDNALVD